MTRSVIKKKVQSYYDITLFLLVLFICVFGLIMVYSTSSYNAYRFYNDSQLYLTRQLKILGIGFAGMILLSIVDYHLFSKPLFNTKINATHILLVLATGLMLFVTVSGYSAGGSARWIKLPGGFNLQPSEILKIAVILLAAYSVSAMSQKNRNRFAGFFRILLYVAIPVGLVAVENLTTAIIIFVIVAGICFVASMKNLMFVLTGLGAGAVGALLIVFRGYRSERINIWLNVETASGGYQIMQGLYAIASGGLLGKGLGESMQKLGYIPEAHTDMIFSVICEELGMIGAIAVIALFLMVLWRLFRIAINAPDLFGGLIATGVLIHIAIQVLINIAVVTNLIPPTGIPLPLISYGGSSQIVFLGEIGIALSVSNQTVRELDT
ncbi:MAG: FtsW/RodA/SpoVE family cell cycle protein [Lachnospiraceae bacterium]|nr:FtsW/RodA/SpoVE family cell cycle protein [Lachnospiraceae bacterium]